MSTYPGFNMVFFSALADGHREQNHDGPIRFLWQNGCRYGGSKGIGRAI
jgi:hypothetical protein